MLLTWYFENFTTKPTSDYLGLGLIGLGFLLAFNSIARFIRAKTGVVPFSESTTLITERFLQIHQKPNVCWYEFLLIRIIDHPK